MNNTEPIYSNLTKIWFPDKVYRADLNLDKKEIKAKAKEKGIFIDRKPSLFDYAVAYLKINDIRFPHDWIVWNNSILTFHDLQDPQLPLAKLIDQGTAEPFDPEEIYSISSDSMSDFKFLLKQCLQTKLFKLGIKWIREEKLFSFVPLNQDNLGRWKSRSIKWTKRKKLAPREVVKVNYDLKDKTKVFNLKCLAFRIQFELLKNEWYLAIKPDWVFLWSNLSVCNLAFEDIQWLKKNERNQHVFNHYNFILRYLQPTETQELFEEYNGYPYLEIGNMQKFDFAPIVPDNNWRNLEPPGYRKKLKDKKGNVDLFKI